MGGTTRSAGEGGASVAGGWGIGRIRNCGREGGNLTCSHSFSTMSLSLVVW